MPDAMGEIFNKVPKVQDRKYKTKGSDYKPGRKEGFKMPSDPLWRIKKQRKEDT